MTLNEIADRLAASGLLSLGDVATLLAEERPETPPQFIQALTQRGLLTGYQAECVLNGRIEHLVLGNYVVLDKLGQGGMGLVLKARHRRMDRLVALKVLSPDAVRTPLAVERFKREVRAAAKLSHPNIVSAFDADEHRGTNFLVMEYVEGRDLSSIVKTGGPLPVATAAEYITQAACGLEYAHRQGVIHRDIKPGNLILCCPPSSQVGTAPAERDVTVVKILDMGLARINDAAGGSADHDLTATGSVMGTIDYMPPEQALDTRLADARSDIYSLGCSLYYLLTGDTPYGGDTAMRRLLAHRDTPIPELAVLRPDVPPELQSIFRKMLAKSPDDRFQSMTELLLAIRGMAVPAATADFRSFACHAPSDAVTGLLSGTAPHSGRPFDLSATVLQSSVPRVAERSPDKQRSFKFRTTAAVATGFLLVGMAIWFSRAGMPQRAQPLPIEPVEKQSPQVLKAPAPHREPAQQPSEPDPDRRVAEWALKAHGIVHLDKQPRAYNAVADLPQHHFQVTYLYVDTDASEGAFRGDANLKDLLGLTGLRHLQLFDNRRVTDVGVAHLQALPSLETLDLRNTRITDNGLRQLAGVDRLEALILYGDQFTDAGVAQLQYCTKLRSLQLWFPQMTDKGLQQIPELLAGLTCLGIENSKVTNAGLASLGKLAFLEQLSLSSLAITDEGLMELKGLTNLVVLNLSGTRISNAGLAHLQNMTKLRDLALLETGVTAEAIAQLQLSLPDCVIRR